MSRRMTTGRLHSINLLNVVLVVLVSLSVTPVEAFTASFPLGRSLLVTSRPSHRPLYAKKGFGSDAPKKKRAPPATATTDQESQQTSVTSTNTVVPNAPVASTVLPSSTSAPLGSTTRTDEANAGQRALAEMRRRRAEEKDDELRRVRELQRMDQQVQSSPASAAIPEPVAQRMGKRMLPFVGVPLFGIMGAFVTFWYLATYKNLEFDTALVAISTIGILVLGLLGITYSVMSASWDPDREGSALGFDEFQRNAQSIQDGFGRSRENAILREKMTGVSSTELEAALSDLEQREMADTKRQQSLQDKLRNELE